MTDIDTIRRLNLGALIAKEGGQQKFAERANIKNVTQVSQWVRGSKHSVTGKPRVLSTRMARAIEAELGLPSGWMDRDHGASESQAVASRETRRDYVRFSLLDGGAGMGDGVINGDFPEVIREVEMAAWEVRRKLGFIPEDGRIRLITGRGPSMRPMIDNGDVVMVDTAVSHFDGDAVYVINIGGETQIKLLQMRGDGLYVVSKNQDYPAYRVEQAELLHIGGKVVATLGIKEL